MDDWRSWIAQTLPRTELMRGGATAWPGGSDRLIGDALGPVMHLHDGASEIFYFRGGCTRFEVGNTQEFFEDGDFVLVPPQVPHNFWNGGDDDVLVFWVVAPHFVQNKWRTEDISAEEMSLGVIHTRIDEQIGRVEGETKIYPLPGDKNIHSRLVSLPAGERIEEVNRAGQEAVLYVIHGPATIQVGRLSGELREDEFVHVPASTPFSILAGDHSAVALICQMPGIS
jgi:mannose-6-phosphate isomerase-like protein (cupin superfamily)